MLYMCSYRSRFILNSLKMAVAEAKPEEKFHFFWKSKSPFSQWHSAQFTIDDIEYNCAEQYMMYQKASK